MHKQLKGIYEETVLDTLTIALTWEAFCATLQRAFPVPSQLINLAKHPGSA